jgi:hypothetical protein
MLSDIEKGIEMNLIPRSSNNLTVRHLTRAEWYFFTEEENQDGYGVFCDAELIYSNCDPMEASYFFDEVK